MTPAKTPMMLARAGVLILFLLLAACAPTTERWDSQFGDAARLAVAQQTLNPQAGGDAPVNGIDGATARESIGRYRNSFREPPPPVNPFAIGISR